MADFPKQPSLIFLQIKTEIKHVIYSAYYFLINWHLLEENVEFIQFKVLKTITAIAFSNSVLSHIDRFVTLKWAFADRTILQSRGSPSR